MSSKVKTPIPYGSWPSPISSAALTAAGIGLSEVQVDGEDIYWLENRPEEKGRNVIVQYRQAHCRDILPRPLNTRTKVNEYGGGCYCVNEGIVYFVLYDDQRIYRLDCNQPERVPEALTAAGNYCYADLQYDGRHQRLIAVAECHTQPGQEAETLLVSIDARVIDGKQEPRILQQGADFYSCPRLNAKGSKLTWLSWNHPNMPWDGTECWLADVGEQGQLSNIQRIAGGDNESVAQPSFSPSGDLIFVSDRNNWWNLYHWRNGEARCLWSKDAEFAGPQWVFGQRYYGFVDDKQLVGTYSQHGLWHLYQLDISTGAGKPIETALCDIAYIQASADHGAVFVGTGSKSYNAVYQWRHREGLTQIASPVSNAFSAEALSEPRPISFPLSTRDDQGHAFYYPPASEKYCGPADEAPPLLVFCHGGPTSAARASLNLKIQYWTSRGFAVADINYGGSTGFGRRYRDALKQQWGLVDVQDCIDCVNYLVEEKLANRDQLAIRGGSAGGYTVLCALAFHDVFKAGASHYGVGDLETLATDTHKFESRYLDSLVGPYPEQRARYRQRSPIHHLDGFRCPVIFFQGLQDKVVPPNQAAAMVSALDQQGIAHAYVTFEEEGHGFRQAPNQRRALDSELYFYSRVFGFALPETAEAVTIKHLQPEQRA